MNETVWWSSAPRELGGDTRHARFEREAHLDRFVQAHGGGLRDMYEGHDDAKLLLGFASSRWTRERLDAPDVEHGVAAIAAGVAANARSNLEPACSRLLWATRRERLDDSALEGAEHYARLSLATAKRVPEREAAECVCEAVRFVREGRHGDLDARDAALSRMSALAERRVPNFASLVGAHFPFWSFPFAFRWDERAPTLGRGRLGLPDPLDDESVEGLLVLAYRRGRSRGEMAEALERCACAARRALPGGLEQARATGAISELARDLQASWVVRDARSPIDVVERIAPTTLAQAFVRAPGDASRAARRAAAALVPVLHAHWPELSVLGAEHRAFRRARDGDALAA
jgi:hypothetical protein